MSRHIAPRQSRRTRKRTRRAVIGASIVALAVAITAIAFFLLRADITGEAEVVSADMRFQSGGGSLRGLTGEVIATSGLIADCNGQHDAGRLAVQITGAWPGSSCDMQGFVSLTSGSADIGEDAVISGVTFGDGIDAELLEGCGEIVPPHSSTLANHRKVVIRFSVPDGTANGAYPASQDAGVTAVPASQGVDC